MEESRTRTSDEFRARVRIALRAWRFLAYALPRLPLRRSPMYCFQVISHKFLRWWVGPSLPLIVVLNLALLARWVKPHLAVIDGFEAMEGDGPTWGDPVDWRIALAAVDAWQSIA